MTTYQIVDHAYDVVVVGAGGSGLHATLAGVLLALTIPARTRMDPDAFVAKGQKLLQQFARAGDVADAVTGGLEIERDGAHAGLRLQHLMLNVVVADVDSAGAVCAAVDDCFRPELDGRRR